MKNRIKNLILKPVAFALFVKEVNAEMKKDEEIRASQEKIGPYVHHNCPVQIWA